MRRGGGVNNFKTKNLSSPSRRPCDACGPDSSLLPNAVREDLMAEARPGRGAHCNVVVLIPVVQDSVCVFLLFFLP